MDQLQEDIKMPSAAAHKDTSKSLRIRAESAEELIQILENLNVKLVAFMFCDPLGKWLQITYLLSSLTPQQLNEGLPFDASSVRLIRSIHQSDMLMIPDFNACFINPWKATKTAHVLVSVKDSYTDEWYERDPRIIAKRTMQYLQSTGIADDIHIAPMTAFFIFDNVSYDTSVNSSHYRVDTLEGYWNSDKKTLNLAHRPGPQSWFLASEPIDTLETIRTEILLTLEQLELHPTHHQHEIATSQCHVSTGSKSLVEAADDFLLFKFVVRNIAKKYGKSASFLPKPIYGDNGSGVHVHQALWKSNRPLFYGHGPSGLSTTALYYVGGLLRHAPALCAFTNPTTNSYKRLVPGFEAPVNLVFSGANRSAAIRIPMYHVNDPAAKTLEFRVPDPTLNPYLAFSAQLLAGLDGIANKIHPGAPLDVDIYELSAEEKEDLAVTPASLGDALSALEVDDEFLLVGGTFSLDFLDTYIGYKRMELSRLETAPHPLEFEMYYHL